MNRESALSLATELASKQPTLVICGGGHVGYCIGEIGHLLDFKVVLIDDRGAFANPARFPYAQVICKPFSHAIEEIDNPERCYFTIVTRGHQEDYQCVKSILARPFAYIGMMGSKRKAKMVIDRLRQEGIAEALINRIHTPIGVDCHAITPAEIAVSIGAELIAVKNTSQETIYVGSDVVAAIKEELAAVILTIVEKAGSAPRGIGSMLVLKKDGTTVGTIGGGKVEALAIDRAHALVGTLERVYMTCNMAGDKQQPTEMICGGAVTVQIEAVEEKSHK